MSISSVSRFNQVIVPMYELDENGHVKPNPLFHRPIDKLHSRCVEYPFAASRVGDAKSILDVGTIKSNPAWISWLENLPIEVHSTDYDMPFEPFTRIRFHQADLRNLPLPDGIFDKIIAVSAIEHIGLEFPQVLADRVPKVSNEGDIEAVKELARILKPGGELIMTLPFGRQDVLILGNQARNYTIETIKKFDDILDLAHIEYYEYQSKTFIGKPNADNVSPSLKRWIYKKVTTSLDVLLGNRHVRQCAESEIPEEVIWRNVPLDKAMAVHENHTEGVVCGVWKKKNKDR